MLIVALVMALIGLAALVTAVVTSNQVIAWVCIGASAAGVVLLIVDAVRERQRRDAPPAPADDGEKAADEKSDDFDAEYPEDDTTTDAGADAADDVVDLEKPAAEPESPR